jgi:membrane associated rhomboid family serine protease
VSSGPDLFVVCKSCGAEVSPYITECPYCGTRLRKRAPKLDRAGRPRVRSARPRLGRLRPGEIPGIRADSRPYATIALVLASVVLTLVWRAGGIDTLADLAVVEPKLDASNWWHVFTATFVYDNAGAQLVSLAGVAVFGWLLERRHGPIVTALVFLAGGAGGYVLVALLDPSPSAVGGHGAALALLLAWAVPDLLAMRRGLEVESDMIGAAVFAMVLALLPIAVPDASSLAALGGVIAGVGCGLALNRLSRAR